MAHPHSLEVVSFPPARLRPRLTAYAMLFAVAALAAGCGGGGDNGLGQAAPPTSAASSWLKLTPSPIDITASLGKPKAFQITAKSTKIISETIYVAIMDPKGVLSPSVFNISSNASTLTYTIGLSTVGTLPVGTHTGTFEVRLCYDARPDVCSRPLEGSPWQLPYKITVTN